MKRIFKTNCLHTLCVIACFIGSFSINAQEKKGTTITIESKVEGSQEQPNVIYITPWQDNHSVIQIQSPETVIKLPQLKPVNPVLFKKKLKQMNALKSK